MCYTAQHLIDYNFACRYLLWVLSALGARGDTLQLVDLGVKLAPLAALQHMPTPLNAHRALMASIQQRGPHSAYFARMV